MAKSLLDLAPYLVGFAWAGMTLHLFLELKRTFVEAQTRWNKRQQTMQSELGALRSQVQDLRARIDEADRRAETLVPPPAPCSGLNLTKRTHALRLFRRGESPEKVADALSMPRKEAELLLKIQKIVTAPVRD